MVAGVFAGNISAEATTPTGNIFDEATRGASASLVPYPSLNLVL
jgi:hypothetical protein